MEALGNHPSDLLKLYMYGYLNRYRSSRMLEAECKRNLELMWLLRGLQPDHNTINNFRKNNPGAIKRVFRQTVTIAKNMDLIGGILIAGDSTKLRAQNSKKNNYNEKKIQRHLDYIERKLEEHNRALAEADGDQDEDADQNEHHRKEIQKHQKRKKQYHRLAKELKESGESQISTTDPESRHLMIRNNITEVAYNIQSTVDAEHKLLLDYQVTNENDKLAMGPMVARAKTILGNTGFTALFDKGYHTGHQIARSHQLGVETLVAIPAPSKPTKAQRIREFEIENFSYNKDQDYYTCPEGQSLTTNGSWYNKGENYRVKHYKTKACLECRFRHLCTRNKSGRLIERGEHVENIARNREAVEQNPELYKQRQALVEHPFGTLKRQWGFDHVLTKKGMKRASADVGLMMLAYNFRRLLSIFGANGMKKVLKALFPVFFFQNSLSFKILGLTRTFKYYFNILILRCQLSLERLIFGHQWLFCRG